MLKEKLKNYHIILTSGSPRRQEFFSGLGIDFEVRLKPVKENYPSRLRHFEISDYLAQLKSLQFENELQTNDILITSDTIVWHNNKALGKPGTEQEAFEMLKSMPKLAFRLFLRSLLPFYKYKSWKIQYSN